MKTRTRKTKPDIVRSLTQFFHCQGTTCSGWKTAAVALIRCQVADRQQMGNPSWDAYPSNRWGWITDTGRCIGVGEMPSQGGVISKHELLIPVPLPFNGSGKSLRAIAEKAVRAMNRKLSRR